MPSKLWFVMLNRNDLVIKLFLIILNKNDLIIKLFLDLFLVSIYVKYMYMCVHMCIMNMHVHGGAYVFSCFPCCLGLTMTASCCLSPN